MAIPTSPNINERVTAIKNAIALNSNSVMPTVSRVKKERFSLFSLFVPRPSPFKIFLRSSLTGIAFFSLYSITFFHGFFNGIAKIFSLFARKKVLFFIKGARARIAKQKIRWQIEKIRAVPRPNHRFFRTIANVLFHSKTARFFKTICKSHSSFFRRAQWNALHALSARKLKPPLRRAQ